MRRPPPHCRDGERDVPWAHAHGHPSDLLLPAARIVAAPLPRHPCGMLADPLRDIGLRGHHALLERTVPRELKRLFLAVVGIGDGTNGQDDFNQSVLHSNDGLATYARLIVVFQISRNLSPTAAHPEFTRQLPTPVLPI